MEPSRLDWSDMGPYKNYTTQNQPALQEGFRIDPGDNAVTRAVAVAQVVERRTPQAIFKACVSSKLTYGSAAFV